MTAPTTTPPPTVTPEDEPSSVPDDAPSDDTAPSISKPATRPRQRRDPKPVPLHGVSDRAAASDNVGNPINLSHLNTGSIIAAAAREAGDIGEALHVREGYARGKRTLLQTLSFGRALIAWMWGTIVALGIRSVPLLIVPHITTETLGLYQAVSYATLVVAVAVSGAPWLYFRWRDAKKAGAALTGSDIFAMLALGGLVTYAAARVTISVLNMFGV